MNAGLRHAFAHPPLRRIIVGLPTSSSSGHLRTLTTTTPLLNSSSNGNNSSNNGNTNKGTPSTPAARQQPQALGKEALQDIMNLIKTTNSDNPNPPTSGSTPAPRSGKPTAQSLQDRFRIDRDSVAQSRSTTTNSSSPSSTSSTSPSPSSPTSIFASFRNPNAPSIPSFVSSPSNFASPGSFSSILNNTPSPPPELVENEHLPRMGPTAGRSIVVQGDVVSALTRLRSIVQANRVRQDMNKQRFHERPGLKRKRLRRERHKKRFKEAFKRMVGVVLDMKNRGM